MTRATRNVAHVAIGPAASSGALKLRAWKDLHIRWSYRADRDLRPNDLEIEMFNLSPESRAELDRFDDEDAELLVVLFAGGDTDAPPEVAIADIVDVQHTRKGPDVITTIEAGEGERSYTDSHISVSMMPGATIENILDEVTRVYAAGGVTIDRSRLNDLPQVRRLRGFSYEGRTSDVLEELTAELGISASVQGGKLSLSSDTPPATLRAVLVSAETGMIGTPKRKRSKRKGDRVEVRVLYRLAIQPGDLVSVKSVAWSGVGVVEEVDASGDTHGEAIADLSIRPVDP